MKAHNPWPIAIIGFFCLFASGLAAFIVFASRERVDLVRSDYYEEELRYQHQLERLRRTSALAQSATVRFDAQENSIIIQLPPGHGAGVAGEVHLYRPSDAHLDRQIALAVNPQGTQRVDAAQLRAGLWKVRVQWTRAGQEYFVDESIVLPGTGRS